MSDRSGERFARKVCAYVKQVFKWAVKEGLSQKIVAMDQDMPGEANSEDYLDTTHLSIYQLDKL